MAKESAGERMGWDFETRYERAKVELELFWNHIHGSAEAGLKSQQRDSTRDEAYLASQRPEIREIVGQMLAAMNDVGKRNDEKLLSPPSSASGPRTDPSSRNP